MTKTTPTTTRERAASTRDEIWRTGRARADPRRIGALIGTIGGVVFVVANAWVLPAPGDLIAGIAAIAMALAIVVRLFVVPRALGEPRRPHRFAWAIYGASVVGMFAMIAIGRPLLVAAGHELAAPSLIAIAVGLHFIPFAVAFREPMLTWLGTAVAAVGLLGLVFGLLVEPALGTIGAIVAGFAQLVILALYAFDSASGATRA